MDRIFEKIRQNQFGFFILASLGVALMLMSVSLWMYNEFGTAQLDLSRPSLQEAREQAKRDAEAEKNQKKTANDFSSDGKISSDILRDFEKRYNEKLEKVNGEFFGENALSDETLNLK